MQCILSALKAESDPLINFFKLKKDDSYSFPFYKKNDLCLIGIGVGKNKIEKTIFTFLNDYNSRSLQFINIGIAGGKINNSEKGEIYLINKIKDENSNENYFPDLIVNSKLLEHSTITVDKAIVDGGGDYNCLVDMEASEIYKVCLKRVLVHQISFLKIVSDYMDEDVTSISKNKINSLINEKLPEIDTFLKKYKNLQEFKSSILGNVDLVWISRARSELNLTETQYHQLLSFSRGYRLKNPNKKFEDNMILKVYSKTERNKNFKNICEILSA